VKFNIINKILKIFRKENIFRIDEHDITGENYRHFIKYALEQSDVFTFCIPNFEYLRVTDKNRFFADEEDIADCATPTNIKDNEYFKAYKQNVKPLLNIIEDQIIITYNETAYHDQIRNHDMEIYIVGIKDFDKCFEFLTSAGSLFSWRADKYPEDICFFNNGCCWLQSIAHEGYCFVMLDDAEIQQKLKDMGLKFTLSDEKIDLEYN